MIDGLTGDPSTAMLASVIGISIIVALVMNILVRPMLVSRPLIFDLWAPGIAAALGAILAILGSLQRGDGDLVGAFLVGLFGGYASQNANTIVMRTARGVGLAKPEGGDGSAPGG